MEITLLWKWHNNLNKQCKHKSIWTQGHVSSDQTNYPKNALITTPWKDYSSRKKGRWKHVKIIEKDEEIERTLESKKDKKIKIKIMLLESHKFINC